MVCPSAPRCGCQFRDWWAHDRHVRRQVCRNATLTTATPSIVDGRSTSLPRTKAPTSVNMIDDKTLIDNLKSEGVRIIDQDSRLRYMMGHHCCVCNQWFDKNHHLTHHGNLKHSEIFGHGKRMLSQLRADWGIRPIMYQCRYCDAIYWI